MGVVLSTKPSMRSGGGDGTGEVLVEGKEMSQIHQNWEEQSPQRDQD
jgi:hypothetical protein